MNQIDRRTSKAGHRTPLGLLMPYGSEPPVLAMQFERPDAQDCDKRLSDLGQVFDRFGIADGAVLSFHHHYRNGDRLMNAVVALAQARGIKGLTLAPSSVFPAHAPLVAALEDGTVGALVTDYMRGPVADWIGAHPGRINTLLQSHGGRARAISAGQLVIDVAFVGAPLADASGNATGRGGTLACGPLGYPAVDARYARRTVVAAHEVAQVALPHVDIPARFVDAVVPFEKPGDAQRIVSGSTIPAVSAEAAAISSTVADVTAASGLMDSSFSLQSGAGGYSLAAVPAIGRRMVEQGVTGAFVSGGITAAHVALQDAGIFREIRDVQCFDLAAVTSSGANPAHKMMNAAEYASPLNPHACVNDLSVMLLGAVEVDLDFNVNVVVGSDGRILGGPGGHPDTAQGAKLSIVTTSLTGGGFAKIVPKVASCSTLGKDIDVVVTEVGFAINPRREDLIARVTSAGLRPLNIADLAAQATAITSGETHGGTHVPGVCVEHRNGTILDLV